MNISETCCTALLQGHYEMPPYTEGTMRSAYHVRELEAYRLAQASHRT